MRNRISAFLPSLSLLAVVTACAHSPVPVEQPWPLAAQNWGDGAREYRLAENYYWQDEGAAEIDSAGTEPDAEVEESETDLTFAPITNPSYPAYDWRAQVWRSSVQKWIQYYSGKGIDLFDIAERRAASHYELLMNEAVLGGMKEPPVGLAIAESGANPKAYSRAGAAGMWQFMRATGKLYGLDIDYWVDERMDVVHSTRESLRHLRDLYDQFGSWELAYAAYNSGARRVSRAIKFAGSRDYWVLQQRRFIPRETRNYVPKIIAIRYLLEQRGWNLGPRPLDVEPMRYVEVPPMTGLKKIASLLEMDAKELADLNPTFRMGTVPPDRSAHLVLPESKASLFAERMTEGVVNWLTEPKSWKLNKAASPQGLQQLYGIPARQTATLNKVSLDHMFSAGDSILLPVDSLVADSAITQRREQSIYKVRHGDTLSEIARRTKTSVHNLRTWNNLRSSRIFPGQRLIVWHKPAQASWLKDS